MPAPISVIIPTLNASAGLPACLQALMPGLEAGLIRELVISDGGSDDTTAQIADEAGAVLVTGPSGRGGQLARGVAAAKGTWILLLHADTVLSSDWVEAAEAHLASPDLAGYFRLRFRAKGLMPRLVAGWANLRSRLFKLPYGDQGLLLTQDLLADVGGVPALPLMEDVALARRLGPRLTMLEATALTAPDRFQRDGWIRRGTRNLWTLARYYAGVDPAKLARDYVSSSSRN